MVIHAETQASAVREKALRALARAVASAALRPTLAAALDDVAEAARVVSGADLALVRVPAGEDLRAVAVAGPSALAAELDGTQLAAADLPPSTVVDLADAPQGIRRAAGRAGARSVLVIPVRTSDAAGTLELYRAGAPFTQGERTAAELAGAHAALVLRAFGVGEARTAELLFRPALELAGDALTAALGERHSGSEVVRVAANIVGAPIGLLWERSSGEIELAGSFGLEPGADLGGARELVRQAFDEPGPLRAVASDRLPGGCGSLDLASARAGGHGHAPAALRP